MIYGIWPTSLFDRGTHKYPYVYTIHYTLYTYMYMCVLFITLSTCSITSQLFGLKNNTCLHGLSPKFQYIYMLQSKSSWIYIHWKYISKVRSFGNFQLKSILQNVNQNIFYVSGQVFKKWYILESVYKNVKETIFFKKGLIC